MKELLQLFETNLVRKKNLEDLVWVKKTGEKILFRDMSTEHLVNCLRMLERSSSKRIEAAMLYAKLYQFNVAREFDERAQKFTIKAKQIAEHLSYRI